MARLPAEGGVRRPAFGVVANSLCEGRAWNKLSGPYLESSAGPADDFRDIDPIAKAWIACAPDRMARGSDWSRDD